MLNMFTSSIFQSWKNMWFFHILIFFYKKTFKSDLCKFIFKLLNFFFFKKKHVLTKLYVKIIILKNQFWMHKT